MAAAVCQGSGSWLDPGYLLRKDPPIPFNLGLSPSSFSGCSTDGSFLEAISTGDRRAEVGGRQPVWKQGVYVHTPVVNLELCTENLGNETGSDMSDSESVEAGDYSLLMTRREERLLKPSLGRATKVKEYTVFPPPLMTIKGEEPLRYKQRREQGRLVLEAVKMSPVNSIFRAERSQGRLTLSFLDHSAPNSDNHVEEAEERDIARQEKEHFGDGKDGITAADMHTKETLKRQSRCKDSDHHRQLQRENSLSFNLGDIIMGGRLINTRMIFWVALLCTIC